jgi:type I restriction enzyme M protein
MSRPAAVQYHLSPVGAAGFALANGSMSTQTRSEDEIRNAFIEGGLANCITTK